MSALLARVPNPAIAANFDPAQFQKQFAELAKINPDGASLMTTDWRGRLQNALIKAESATAMGVEVVLLLATNLGTSVMIGHQEWRRNNIILRWQAQNSADVVGAKSLEVSASTGRPATETSPFRDGGFKDPTKWLGMPAPIWLLLGTGVIALLLRNAAPFVGRGFVLGVGTAWVSAVGVDWGQQMALKKATTASNAGAASPIRRI